MEQTGITHPSRTEFEALSNRCRQRAFGLACRLTGNETDAEDLTQDALVRAWGSFDSYDPGRSFEAWLMRIVYNLAIDRWRRKSSAPMPSLDHSYRTTGTGASLGSILPDRKPGPEQQCILNLLSERLQVALGLLPPRYRMAVILADIGEHSYEEVAQKMRCPVGTVRSRLHRGRLALRKTLNSPIAALMD